MSIASMWNEKLMAANLTRDGKRFEPFLVGYEDLRTLVDDALELERIQQTLLPRATAMEKRFEAQDARIKELNARCEKLMTLLGEAKAAALGVRRDGSPEEG